MDRKDRFYYLENGKDTKRLKAELNPEWWTLDKRPHSGFFVFKDIDILYLFNLDGRTIHEQTHLQSRSNQTTWSESSRSLSVSDRTIQYKGEFKIHAVRENLAGKRPIQIFEESGFDLDMIGKQTPNDDLRELKHESST